MLNLLKKCIACAMCYGMACYAIPLNGNESIYSDTLEGVSVTNTSSVIEVEKQKEVVLYQYQLCNNSFITLNRAIFGHKINESLDIEFSDANKGWSETSLNEVHYSMTQGLLPNTCINLDLRLHKNSGVEHDVESKINPQLKTAVFQEQWLFASL